jgi:hypothetical protein
MTVYPPMCPNRIYNLPCVLFRGYRWGFPLWQERRGFKLAAHLNRGRVKLHSHPLICSHSAKGKITPLNVTTLLNVTVRKKINLTAEIICFHSCAYGACNMSLTYPVILRSTPLYFTWLADWYCSNYKKWEVQCAIYFLMQRNIYIYICFSQAVGPTGICSPCMLR